MPDFAVYLLSKDPVIERRPYRWVRWRDFLLPDSTDDVITALREARARSEFERVEIVCGSGVGRTGTAMSLLAVTSGVAPDDAVRGYARTTIAGQSKHDDSSNWSGRPQRGSASERPGVACSD